MPGAYNLPFGDLIDKDGRLVSDDEIRTIFEAAGLDLSRPLTTTCGSGVTAAILTLRNGLGRFPIDQQEIW
jgi:thiosulfate/3-mercaptopyruvate sulfurtransferase